MTSNWWSDPEDEQEPAKPTSAEDAFKVEDALFGDSKSVKDEARAEDRADPFDLDSILSDSETKISSDSWTTAEAVPSSSENGSAPEPPTAVAKSTPASDVDAYNWRVHVDVDQPVQREA
jgi:hypothetical protein